MIKKNQNSSKKQNNKCLKVNIMMTTLKFLMSRQSVQNTLNMSLCQIRRLILKRLEAKLSGFVKRFVH